jgi:hypothetical protein
MKTHNAAVVFSDEVLRRSVARVRRSFVGNLRFAKVPLPQDDNLFGGLQLTKFT